MIWSYPPPREGGEEILYKLKNRKEFELGILKKAAKTGKNF